MDKKPIDFRTFKKKESDIKNLLNAYPMSNYSECQHLLETMTYDEAMDHLRMSYQPKEALTAKATQSTAEQIRKIKKQHPDMDDNICQIYLEDYNYDLNLVLSRIKHSKLLRELPLSKNEDSFRLLKNLYPDIDDELITEAINDSECDLESAIDFLEQIIMFNTYAESVEEDEDIHTIEEVIEGDGYNYDVDEDDYLHQVFPNLDMRLIRGCLRMFDDDTVDAVEFITNALSEGKDLAKLVPLDPPVPSFCPKKIEYPPNFLKPNTKLKRIDDDDDRNTSDVSSNEIVTPYKAKITKKKKTKPKHNPVKITAEEAIEQRLIKTRNNLKIDLHGLTLTVAYKVFQKVISIAKASNIHNIYLITGKGIHSNGCMPILRPYLLDVCRLERIKAMIDPRNSGQIKCYV